MLRIGWKVAIRLVDWNEQVAPLPDLANDAAKVASRPHFGLSLATEV
jgi:hypothetical protein